MATSRSRDPRPAPRADAAAESPVTGDVDSAQEAAVQDDLHRYIAPVVGPDDERIFTDSGIELKRLYDESDVKPNLEERLGEPGSPPFTRGIHNGMYRDRLWTMRQYAGFATPEDTNERYRYLIEHGSTGLSMAFDLPTQLGRDSDDPLCRGEVGRTGVPIDTIEDMRICFDQIPLDQVSTSMTINAPAAILLLLYELVGEEQGVESQRLRGTVQNDVLKEYMARGNYIYPPEPTMRLTTDIFEYCHENVPKWNTISISGYHIREKGCSAVQEVAFTLSNAIAYVEAALDRGLEIDEFAPRLAFFFNCHNNVFQEIAKFRAVRRMWAEIVRDRFGAKNESSMKIRFHTQTGGVTLQAQQPEVNIIRVALQGFAAVSGGTQSLHTNGFDEALALPTERSARIALRTQQVLAHESGAADTVDPFAGSYFVESLTDEIELRAKELMGKVSELGGSVVALDFMQREIEESALSYHERYRTGQDIVVGVNKYVTDQVDDVDILRVDQESEDRQLARLKNFKENRDNEKVRGAPRRAARCRRGRREPPAPDPRGARRQRLDRRGLRRDARGLRRVPGRGVLLIVAVLLAAVTAVGFALRFGIFGDSPFADELSTYWIVYENGLTGTWDVVHTDAEITPPLYFLLAELATKIDLTPEMPRLPSLLAGTATIPLVFLVGDSTVGRRAALVAAALVALSPFMTYYSAEARGYQVMILCPSSRRSLLCSSTRDDRGAGGSFTRSPRRGRCIRITPPRSGCCRARLAVLGPPHLAAMRCSPTSAPRSCSCPGSAASSRTSTLRRQRSSASSNRSRSTSSHRARPLGDRLPLLSARARPAAGDARPRPDRSRPRRGRRRRLAEVARKPPEGRPGPRPRSRPRPGGAGR